MTDEYYIQFVIDHYAELLESVMKCLSQGSEMNPDATIKWVTVPIWFDYHNIGAVRYSIEESRFVDIRINGRDIPLPKS